MKPATKSGRIAREPPPVTRAQFTHRTATGNQSVSGRVNTAQRAREVERLSMLGLREVGHSPSARGQHLDVLHEAVERGGEAADVGYTPVTIVGSRPRSDSALRRSVLANAL